MTWTVTRTQPGVVHLTPDHDLVEHDIDDSCPCGPTDEYVLNPHGPDGWLSIHHSLDGREANEPSRPT